MVDKIIIAIVKKNITFFSTSSLGDAPSFPFVSINLLKPSNERSPLNSTTFF